MLTPTDQISKSAKTEDNFNLNIMTLGIIGAVSIFIYLSKSKRFN